MATRTNNDVTLSHEDAITIAQILSDYARGKLEHARRTKSAPVRAACQQEAETARQFASDINSRLWTWKE